MVNQFVSMLADRAQKFTTQLETKEPADLLNDVRRFAARRPGTFLAIAAGVGLVAGRLTRGLSDSDDDDRSSAQRAVGQSPVPRPTTPPAVPTTPPVRQTPPPVAPVDVPADGPHVATGAPSDTPIGDSLGRNPLGRDMDKPSNQLDDIVDRGDQR